MSNTGGAGRSFETIKEDLARSIRAAKKPADLVVSLIYSIPIFAPVRICIELGVFEHLSRSSVPLSAASLAKDLCGHTDQNLDNENAARDFLVRMLRAVQAIGLVDEVAEFTYLANALTHAMAEPGFAAGFQLTFDNLTGPKSTMSEMLAYHKANGWRAAASANDGPWQRARDVVGTSTFDSWIAGDPIQLTRLNALIQRMQSDRLHWTEWFPEDRLFQSAGRDPEQSLVFVDVGGGRGHDIMAFAKKYAERPVSLLLQDLRSTIGEVRAKMTTAGIEVCVHDFVQPQPVQGADIYYMHKIMHDWPNKDCVRILAHLRDAMTPQYRILINEVILPNRGCSLLHACFDINMLALHSGKERDEASWERLISQVGGLSITGFWHAPNDEGEGIVEVGRAIG